MKLFKGTKKADVLGGQPGDDIIYGKQGGDRLYGGDGNDIIFGGKGRDFLYGGEGDNHLTGGKGKDVFVISTEADLNIITDFTPGDDLVVIDDPAISGYVIPTPVEDFGYSHINLTYKGEAVAVVSNLDVNHDVLVA